MSSKTRSSMESLFILLLTSTFAGLSDLRTNTFPILVDAKDVEKVPELDLSKMINENVSKATRQCFSTMRYLPNSAYRIATIGLSLMSSIKDSKIFVRKREEHKLLVNHLQSIDDYGKRYKLMKVGVDEIIRIIREEGGKLRGNQITSESEFPKLQELINALALFLENTCLFGEIVLHFPDMSYRILKSVSDWRTLMTDALNYSKAFVQILDDKSIELLSLLNQEINEDQRTPDYINPYRETAPSTESSKDKQKKKSKPKKGPALSPAKTEL